jgi:hypothetical protein
MTYRTKFLTVKRYEFFKLPVKGRGGLGLRATSCGFKKNGSLTVSDDSVSDSHSFELIRSLKLP